MANRKIPTDYDELLLATRPRVIRDDAEHARQLEWIDRLMMAEGSNPTCEARIEITDLLAALVTAWEEEVSPMPKVAPRDMLKHVMECRGISAAELARSLGIHAEHISSIMTAERAISRELAGKLATYFNLPESFFFEGSIKES